MSCCLLAAVRKRAVHELGSPPAPSSSTSESQKRTPRPKGSLTTIVVVWQVTLDDRAPQGTSSLLLKEALVILLSSVKRARLLDVSRLEGTMERRIADELLPHRKCHRALRV
mmetsp:Transcript_4618/g.12293  ORF Transcript_4618/g.12293 Transcript_4618/m.12293 type:complete len:112 (+) Transcript_4618:162-497(+)